MNDRCVLRLFTGVAVLACLFLLAACAPAIPLTPAPPATPPLDVTPPDRLQGGVEGGAVDSTSPSGTNAPLATPPPDRLQGGVEGGEGDSHPQPGSSAPLNPLTGLPPAAPANLERRPLLIKVENLPRNHRPQSGLNAADLVFEYYTEEGTTRFAALFYGQNAERVAPIRSARYFDVRLIQSYKANFVFGGAYERLWQNLVNAEFGRRLIVEGAGSCPALCRTDPNGANLLAADTARLADYLRQRGMDDTRQNLEGMVFQARPPAGGQPATQVFVRFSAAIYNRWDYDPTSAAYHRFSDTQDDLNGAGEQYAPLTDKLTGEPVSAANLVVLVAPYFQADPQAGSEVLDVRLEGSGPAYLLRDGRIFTARWSREHNDAVITLRDEAGRALAFKPGNTWFEVVGETSQIAGEGGVWRVGHRFP